MHFCFSVVAVHAAAAVLDYSGVDTPAAAAADDAGTSAALAVAAAAAAAANAAAAAAAAATHSAAAGAVAAALPFAAVRAGCSTPRSTQRQKVSRGAPPLLGAPETVLMLRVCRCVLTRCREVNMLMNASYILSSYT